MATHYTIPELLEKLLARKDSTDWAPDCELFKQAHDAIKTLKSILTDTQAQVKRLQGLLAVKPDGRTTVGMISRWLDDKDKRIAELETELAERKTTAEEVFRVARLIDADKSAGPRGRHRAKAILSTLDSSPEEVPAARVDNWTCQHAGVERCMNAPCRLQSSSMFAGKPKCPWGSSDTSEWELDQAEEVPTEHAEATAKETDGGAEWHGQPSEPTLPPEGSSTPLSRGETDGIKLMEATLDVRCRYLAETIFEGVNSAETLYRGISALVRAARNQAND